MGRSIGILAAPVRAVTGVLKAFTMRWPGRAPWTYFWLPRTRYDYAKEVGDPLASSIVVACVNWIARAFPEAPVMVVEELPDGSERKVIGHPLPDLIERPNPWYSGPLLWMATLGDWTTDGNAYWLKIRDRRGDVAELWWAPAWSIEPRWPEDGRTFISHYEYKIDPARDPVVVDPADVVHFRYGLDPDNPRKGRSPLRSLMRELFTDAEAANMTAALMKNLGVPGVILSPDGFGGADAESAEQIKQEFTEKFGGDRRGEPMVMTAPTKVQVLSFSPEQMNLTSLRRVPEERVSAVLGISPMVVGFGSGLEHSSFTNYESALGAAWNQNLIPSQRLMAADLELQLLPDFRQGRREDVAFDYSKVRALQPDMDKVFERQDRAVRGGWQTVGGALRAVGLPSQPADEVYLRPLATVAIAAGTPPTALMPSLNGSAPKGLKQADPHMSFVSLMALARSRLVEVQAGLVEAFFQEQAHRVEMRLRGLVNVRASRRNGRKDPIIGPRSLLPADEDELLKDALTPLWLTAMEQAWNLAADVFGLETRFSASSGPATVCISEGFHRARRINDGTRAALATAIEDRERRGLTTEQVIEGIADENIRSLSALAASHYAGRPATIANTEITWATNRGATGAYRSNNIPRVQIVDSGTDPACEARNGLVVAIVAGETAANNEHPNGALMLIPSR